MKKIIITFAIFILSTCCLKTYAINSDAVLQYNIGIDYYKIGQYENAITSFRNAINIDSNYIDAYYNLGTVYETLHQYDAALAVFKQIIVRKPDDYDAVYKAAWLSYKMGETQKAKTYLGIIPLNSARGKDAQALASEMNYTLTPTQTTVAKTQSSQISVPIKTNTAQKTQTVAPKKPAPKSGIYQNIPAPTGIATDKDGNVYVAEFNNNSVLKITPDDKKIIFVKNQKISGPIGLAIDKSKNLYIANYNKDNILKVSPLGEISVLISCVKKPYYLYIDGTMLYISCQGSNSVLKYRLK